MHDEHKVNLAEWKKALFSDKSATWLIITLKNGEEHYIKNSDGWHLVKDVCETKNTFIDKLSLQFKSHRETVDVSNVDGLYFSKSVIGILGGESKQTYTIGKINDGVVHKSMWLIPELIVEKEYDDDESSCFAESIIYDKEKTN
jgi:hypothetical protein